MGANHVLAENEVANLQCCRLYVESCICVGLHLFFRSGVVFSGLVECWLLSGCLRVFCLLVLLVLFRFGLLRLSC